jgi:glucose-6-phosphate 1-epimerase
MEVGRGGLKRLLVTSSQASAEIYLHGAHLTHFQPRGGRPVLFTSGKSWFEPGKPIRGGIPICFPWFTTGADGKRMPSHGFARLAEWELASAEQGSDGTIELVLRLSSNEKTRQYWEADFEIEYRLQIGVSLHAQLCVRNKSRHSISIEEALHTYLAVSDVRHVTVEGLANTTYLDTVGAPRKRSQDDVPITIAGETDRVYLDTQSTCFVDDPGRQRRLIVEKTGSKATVLWNPWIAKAKAMPDFGDDEWPRMLCIETCNVREYAVALEPDQTHAMETKIRVEKKEFDR